MHQRNVLIVEDEVESGFLVQASLKSIENKINIDWVKTAEEAESILKSDPNYDLIIADHFLDGPKTGLDLWKACQQRYHNVPFLMTSAMDPNVFSILVADESERPLFLHKPFRIEECKNMVEWFWEEEEEEEKNILRIDLSSSSDYQIIIMGILFTLSVILMSSKLEFSKHPPIVTQEENLSPSLKLTIPTFDQNKKSKYFKLAHKQGLIQSILSTELNKEEVLIIQPRADDVLNSLGSGAENNNLKTHLPKGLSDFNGRFEKYGHLQRLA